MRQSAKSDWRTLLATLAAAILLVLGSALVAPTRLLAEPAVEELVTVEVDFRLYQDGTAPEPEEASLEPQSDYGTDYAGVRAAINTGLMHVEESISLDGLNVHKDELVDLLVEVINANPDLFYADSSASISYYPSTGLVAFFEPHYAYDASVIPDMKAEYYDALDEVLSWVPEGATDVQKAKAVHDWLVRNCAYNLEASEAGSENYELYPWSAYGALVNRRPVCQGYSLAFMAAMRAMGIPCTFVEQWESEANGHAWNRVYLVVDGDGAWYNLDVTHDDALPDGGFDEVPSTTYFLKSDGWFQTNPSGGVWHAWWEPEGEAGTDTRFDSYATSDWPTYDGPAGTVVAPESFELSPEELTMEVYSAADIAVVDVEPANASWYERVWRSEDETIAAVDRSGHVTTAGKTGSVLLHCTIGDVERVVEVTVVKRNIANAEAEGIAEVAYDGTAQEPVPTVTYNGATLTAGTDYSVTYRDNVGPGTAVVVITGMGNYTGELEVEFEIASSRVDIADAEAAAIPDQPYTGEEIEPEPQLTYDGRTLVRGVDYEASYSRNVGRGTATVTVSGIGTFTGQRDLTFEIVPANIEEAEVSGLRSVTYNGKAQVQALVVTLGGRTLAEGVDYTLSYANNTNVGTATITITGKGNYSGTRYVTFKNTRASISVADVTVAATRMYTGSALRPAPVVKLGGVTLKNGTDYSLTYKNNTTVGTATITITGKGSYTGTKTVTFKITRANISGATVAKIADKPYTGSAIKPSPKVTMGGRTLVKDTDYTLSYSNNVRGGTATITITGKGNYSGTKTATFRIVAPSVTYRVHVQTYGWQSWRKDGAAAGTSGESKRLEGINIKLASAPYSGGITYRVHVQRIGWQGWRSDGAMAGTSGQSLRLEAIQIKLTGDMAAHYDVYYRVHAQHFGWMGWAKNGQSAGTAGYAYRLEAIEIVIVPKGAPAPGPTANAFRQKK